VWAGLSTWFGVEPSRLGELLPNAANFARLLQAEELFSSFTA